MPLQRETVVRAALRLLDEGGLDGLTVRRLAGTLGVQNPALYWHFKNKQDLLDQMAEAMLADAFAVWGPPAPGAPGADCLAALARTLRRALLSHRDGVRVLAGADLTGSAILTALDRALHALRAAGFPSGVALVGALAVVNYTLGAAFEEQAEPRYPASDGGPARPKPLRAAIDPDRLPALAAALADVARDAPEAGHDPAAGFEGGLQLILAGMRAALSHG